jgi:Toxin co-regulated pilus biosynthesis protein Q.
MPLNTRSWQALLHAGRVAAALVLAGPAPLALAQSGEKGRSAWAVMSGAELRTTLEGWARVAGWTLVWDSEVDYRLRASARFDGDFENAVAKFVDAIHNTAPELRVTLYRGNRVIHVETTPVETR